MQSNPGMVTGALNEANETVSLPLVFHSDLLNR